MLGQRPKLDQPMGKAAALAEAKSWLRNLTIVDVDHLMDELPPNVRSTIQRRRKGTTIRLARPFEHPYYWAPFVLIGDRT
jgi:CHAT domain-containing protein